MNKQVRRLAIGLIVCFTLLFVQLNVIQVVQADDYNADRTTPGPWCATSAGPAGRIISADGAVLAQSVPSGDKFKYQRQYPTGRSVLRGHGLLLVPLRHRRRREAVQRRALGPHREPAGAGSAQLPRRARPTSATSRSPCGRTSRQAAKQALGNREGAVVAIDTRTGAIIALWSYPSYDPNLLASHDFKAVTAARAALLADPGNPLLGETYRERYFPGSTFKIVTTTAGLDTAPSPPTTVYPQTKTLPPAGHDRPDRELRRRVAAATSSRCSGGAATPPSPRWASTLGAPDMVARGPGVRLQPRRRRSTCPGRRQSLSSRRSRLPEQHAEARPGRASARTTCRRRR